MLKLQQAFSGECVYCGGKATDIDHVVPIKSGGGNFYGNLVPACHRCNISKGAKSMMVWFARQGFYNPLRESVIFRRSAVGG